MKTRAEHNRRMQEQYKVKNLCPQCGKAPRSGALKVCASCLKRTRKAGKAYRSRLRLAGFTAYGGAICVCCSEDRVEFLTFDHVNGGGADHRRRIGHGDKLYRWLRDNGYPKGFRILCFNCNYAVFRYGTCPHIAAETYNQNDAGLLKDVHSQVAQLAKAVTGLQETINRRATGARLSFEKDK